MAETQKKENRGGARPGAGRPPGSRQTLSAAQVSALLELAEKRAESEKKSVGEVILDLIYDTDASRKDRLAACKLWTDLTMAKISEDGPADRDLGPSVYLPEHRPTLTAVPGGKSA